MPPHMETVPWKQEIATKALMSMLVFRSSISTDLDVMAPEVVVKHLGLLKVRNQLGEISFYYSTYPW